jgi:hypothetical protein
MMGKLQSLNVSVSAGMLLFKILENRKFKWIFLYIKNKYTFSLKHSLKLSIETS